MGEGGPRPRYRHTGRSPHLRSGLRPARSPPPSTPLSAAAAAPVGRGVALLLRRLAADVIRGGGGFRLGLVAPVNAVHSPTWG